MLSEILEMFRKLSFIEFIKWLIKKYKQIILYLIFGVLTTLVNILSYWFFSSATNMGVMPSNALAWVLSVLFAFVTNKLYVFESRGAGLVPTLKEAMSFTISRVSTGIMDMLIMYFFVEVLFFNDLIIKILSNIFVIIANYILSRFWVFKGKTKEKG